MEKLQDLKDFLKKGYLDYRPNLTLDCAIFGYHEGELKLLLVKNIIFTKWCLPGGYIKKMNSWIRRLQGLRLNEQVLKTVFKTV